jgi:MFS family permease
MYDYALPIAGRLAELVTPSRLGAHAFIWGTTSVTIRQRVVPTNLQGRVGSVNMVGTYGGLVIGSGIGGVLAQHFGVTAPFWFAFVGSAVFVIVIWRQLSATSPTRTNDRAHSPNGQRIPSVGTRRYLPRTADDRGCDLCDFRFESACKQSDHHGGSSSTPSRRSKHGRWGRRPSS